MIDAKKIFEEVRANRLAWSTCSASHHRVEQIDTTPLRSKFRCIHCGGIIGSEIQYYIQGFEAAGGKADDVFPGWYG